jgi:hypothetical protein
VNRSTGAGSSPAVAAIGDGVAVVGRVVPIFVGSTICKAGAAGQPRPRLLAR